MDHFPFSTRLAKRAADRLAQLAPRYFAEKLTAPFFVIGSARSGTTLLIDVLRAHPALSVYPSEANALWHPEGYPWRETASRNRPPPLWIAPHEFTRASVAHRTPAQTRALRAAFGAYQFVTRGRCFANKSAMITFMLPYVQEVFPEARFIHLVRDGRAVALSYTKKKKKKIAGTAIYSEEGYDYPFEQMLVRMAEHWKDHIEEVEKQKRALKLEEQDRLLEIQYERFCSHPERTLQKVVEFMGLRPERMKHDEYAHVRSTNFKFRNELDAATLRQLTETMEPALSQKGYEAASFQKPSPETQ